MKMIRIVVTTLFLAVFAIASLPQHKAEAAIYQSMITGLGRNIVAGATKYIVPSSSGGSVTDTIGYAHLIISAPGAISTLRTWISGSVNANTTTTLVLNDTPTALSSIITTGNTVANDIANSVTVVAGDIISMKLENPSSSQINFKWTMIFTATNAKETNIFSTYSDGGFNTYYYGIGNAWGSNASGAEAATIVAPTSGILRDLYVHWYNQAGASRTITLYLNGQATSLVAAMSGASYGCNDTTHTVSIVAGDLLYIQMTTGGNPGSGSYSGSAALTFVPTIENESIITMGGQTALNAGDYYSSTIYPNVGVGTEFEFRQLSETITLKKLFVRTTTATGADKTLTASLKVNGASPANNLSATGTNITVISDTSHSVNVFAGDFFNILTNATAGVTSSNYSISLVAVYSYGAPALADTLKYEPNTIIIGDTLPDIVNNYDGTITWGANPADITVTSGSLGVPQSTISPPSTSAPPNVVEPISGNGTQDVHASPFAPLFEAMETTSSGALTVEFQAILIAMILAIGGAILGGVASQGRSFFLVLAGSTLGAAAGFAMKFYGDVWILYIMGLLSVAALLLDARKSW
jgi:hypothetical protein